MVLPDVVGPRVWNVEEAEVGTASGGAGLLGAGAMSLLSLD